MQEIMNIIGSLAIAVAIVLGGKWLWHKIPHHASHESDILQRLSEIVMALREQNKYWSTPDTETGVQTGLLLEIRNALTLAPTLDLLRQINEHLFADVASRAQADETIDCIRNLGATIMATTRPEGVGLVHSDVQGVITKLDELELFLKKQDQMKILAIDTLVMDFAKFAKSQQQFVNVLFNGGSISTVGDEEAAEMERINDLMRRYGISREAATERVKGSAVYQPNTGRGRMGAEV